jgi:hypothetical protein
VYKVWIICYCVICVRYFFCSSCFFFIHAAFVFRILSSVVEAYTIQSLHICERKNKEHYLPYLRHHSTQNHFFAGTVIELPVQMEDFKIRKSRTYRKRLQRHKSFFGAMVTFINLLTKLFKISFYCFFLLNRISLKFFILK